MKATKHTLSLLLLAAAILVPVFLTQGVLMASVSYSSNQPECDCNADDLSECTEEERIACEQN